MIQHIDVSGNNVMTDTNPAAQAFMRLLTTNTKTYVEMPRAKAIGVQSMRNRYQNFIPNQFTLMEIEFNKIRHFSDSGINFQTIQDLFVTVHDHGELINKIQAKVEEISIATEQAQQQQMKVISLFCLKQILLERQLGFMRTDMNELKINLQTMKAQIEVTQVSIDALKDQMDDIVATHSGLGRVVEILKAKQADHSDAIENFEAQIENKLIEYRTIFDNLALEMQVKWEQLTASMSGDMSPKGLSPTETEYVEKFKYLLVQMYTVAMVACKGVLQLGSSGAPGTAATILNILSSAAPGPLGGVALSAFAYFLQTTDESQEMQRLERITHMGNPDEIAAKAVQLSHRLIKCIDIEHHVKKGGLTKLLSATREALNTDGFYGVLFDSLQEQGTLAHPERPSTEKRAEQDAKLLFAAIVKEDVPKIDGITDWNRLFLYAMPILTVIDRVFLIMLQMYCEGEGYALTDVKFNSGKRQQFCGRVAKGFHERAELVAVKIENKDDRGTFIQNLATQFSKHQHANNTTGFFYSDSKKQSILPTMGHKKHHISTRNEALESGTVTAVLNCTLGAS